MNEMNKKNAELNKVIEEDTETLVSMARQLLWDNLSVEGVETDADRLALAMKYLKRAIRLGSATAMNLMGVVYYEGVLVPQDYKKAMYWYKKAADAGEIISMTNLGYCYYYGRDTAVDMKKAYQYYSKAALFGDRGALYKVGDMYLNGYFVKKDEAVAFHLYLRCYQSFDEIEDANDEDVCSGVCLRLARCLYEGTGVDKNLDAAAAFAQNAVHFFRMRCRRHDRYCEEGFRQAKELRDRINAELEQQDAQRDAEQVIM